MSKKQTAVIVIPTYNEKENIPALVEALDVVFKKIKNWKMKALIVDDTSPDKTYETVKKIKKKFSFLELLINPTKAGLGAAYLKGMKYAIDKMDADVVFEFDADLSHDQSKIPLFLKDIDKGMDMVLGSRYRKGGGIPEDWGLHRKLLSGLGNIIIMTVFTDFSIRDWTSGYRAIKKEVFEDIEKEMNNERFLGYAFQIGFLHKALRRGYKISEIPYKFTDRTIGYSKLGPEYIKNTLLFIFKVRFLEIINSRIFKFAFVGGIGALIQLSGLQFWRFVFPNFYTNSYQFAFFLSVELAVVSNFLLNNLWTFADKKLKLAQFPIKFIKFNLASGGSIVIQQIVALIGEFSIGLFTLFTVPFINFGVDTGTIFAVVGILVGMFWNFFAYNKFVWNNK